MTVFRLYMFVPIAPIQIQAMYLDRRRLTRGIREVGERARFVPNPVLSLEEASSGSVRWIPRGRIRACARTSERASACTAIGRSGDFVSLNLLSSLLDTLQNYIIFCSFYGRKGQGVPSTWNHSLP